MINKGQLPDAGFYAVIFSSEKGVELDGYAEMDDITMKLASEQKGFLGYESLNNANKTIFISYWENMEAINGWRLNATHQLAKSKAAKWYKRYLSQICLVTQSHYFEQND